jgi:hypothetical protein
VRISVLTSRFRPRALSIAGAQDLVPDPDFAMSSAPDSGTAESLEYYPSGFVERMEKRGG